MITCLVALLMSLLVIIAVVLFGGLALLLKYGGVILCVICIIWILRKFVFK